MNTITYLKNKLKINEKEIEFIYDINKFIQINNIILVLLDPPPKSFYNRNIFCLDNSGNILWQIEEPDYIQNNDSCFTGIWIDEKLNQVKCYNWFGTCHILNIQDGSIDKGKFVK